MRRFGPPGLRSAKRTSHHLAQEDVRAGRPHEENRFYQWKVDALGEFGDRHQDVNSARPELGQHILICTVVAPLVGHVVSRNTSVAEFLGQREAVSYRRTKDQGLAVRALMTLVVVRNQLIATGRLGDPLQRLG